MRKSEKELAEQYASAARANYERDGEVHPILILQSKHKAAICMMKGSENMPLAYGRTLSIGATVMNPEYVVTVTEVWMKSYPVDSPDEARSEAEGIKRGDLGRMAEAGDETVRTALMTIAWSMDPRKAVSIIDHVNDDKTYERTTNTGEQDGYMVECVIGGWRHGLTLPPPPFELSDEQAAEVLALGGDVGAVLFQSV